MKQFFQELCLFCLVCKDFDQVEMKLDFPFCLQMRKNLILKTILSKIILSPRNLKGISWFRLECISIVVNTSLSRP